MTEEHTGSVQVYESKSILDLEYKISVLLEQRDELLDVLENCADYLNDGFKGSVRWMLSQEAFAAIKKYRGLK